MEELNDSESQVFIDTLNKQKEFIENRFSTMRSNRYLNDKMGCLGKKEDIVKHLNQGPAQNLIQTFLITKQKNVHFVIVKKVKMVFANLKEHTAIITVVMIS